MNYLKFNFMKCYAIATLALIPFLLTVFNCNASTQPQRTTPTTIRVVMDDNYPPYVFKSDGGQLQGIIVDQWQLWERKTGVHVELTGMDWGEAQRRMQAGEFDVIDTIFRNEQRALIYDFTKPYARLEVPLFYHEEISGIRGPEDLKGFLVAVKAGDNSIDVLKKNGVTSIAEYPSYEKLIEAARDGKIKVFTVDRPPALYYLNKMGIQNRFLETKAVYSGEFHRAVLKGREEVLAVVENGFAAISPSEYEALDKQWMGTHIPTAVYVKYIFHVAGAVAALIALLLVWLRTLKRAVSRKTVELTASEERYRTLVNNIPLGITLIDRNYRIIMVNQTQSNMFKHPLDWFKGRLCYEAFEKKEATCSHCPGGTSMMSGQVENVDTEGVLDDGRRISVRLHAVPVIAANGETTGFIEVVEDITERLESEQALLALKNELQEQNEELMVNEESLREQNNQLLAIEEMLRVQINEHETGRKLLKASEEKFSALLDNTKIQLWAFDGTVFTYTNKEWFDFTGQSSNSPLTIERWVSVVHPNDLESSGKIWLANLTAKTAHDNYFRLRRHDGVYRDFYSHAVPVNDIDGHFLYFQGFNLDITDRVSRENELLKMEKLESLGVLAGGIAHDFNNILAGVIGNISLAQRYIDAAHKANKPLAEADKASARAAELAQQLLTFARGGEPIKKTVSLQYIVNEAISLVLHGSNVKGIVNIPDVIYAIYADEGQMSQVFHNLFINAMQAMPGGGLLVVTALNDELADNNLLALPPGNYVRITCTDQGCGISTENQKKIFEPYFTTKVSGHGLGLASVYSIISKHGGHISATSRIGKGTSFTIYLPTVGNTYSNGQIKVIVNSAGTHAGGVILVMDDEETIRNLVTEMLEIMGYHATTCENGTEAIQLYKDAIVSGTPFSAVIMDLTIPGGLGGKETAQQLLAIDPDACLIVSSGYSNDPIMSDFVSYGFAGAVAKPYKISELDRQLSALLTVR